MGYRCNARVKPPAGLVEKPRNQGAKHRKAGAAKAPAMMTGAVRVAVEGFGKEKDSGKVVAVERPEGAAKNAARPPTRGMGRHRLPFKVSRRPKGRRLAPAKAPPWQEIALAFRCELSKNLFCENEIFRRFGVGDKPAP
jgi:hypothetical protein